MDEALSNLLWVMLSVFKRKVWLARECTLHLFIRLTQSRLVHSVTMLRKGVINFDAS
jgi:uncharacterized protein YjhX (UPF0386 family)